MCRATRCSPGRRPLRGVAAARPCHPLRRGKGRGRDRCPPRAPERRHRRTSLIIGDQRSPHVRLVPDLASGRRAGTLFTDDIRCPIHVGAPEEPDRRAAAGRPMNPRNHRNSRGPLGGKAGRLSGASVAVSIVPLVMVGTEETRLIVVRGNSASGKSSVAAGLRERFGRNLALVGQDTMPRVVLRERDRPGAANIGLIGMTARYALDAGFHTVVEGILYADRYGAMLEDLVRDHRGISRCYYAATTWTCRFRKRSSGTRRSPIWHTCPRSPTSTCVSGIANGTCSPAGSRRSSTPAAPWTGPWSASPSGAAGRPRWRRWRPGSGVHSGSSRAARDRDRPGSAEHRRRSAPSAPRGSAGPR